MKKLSFFSVLLFLIIACNSPESSEPAASTSAAGDDMKALYEKNLSTLKASISDFENENLSNWSNYVADTVVWNSPAYGDTDSTKAHWLETLQFYIDNWDNIKLNNANFLPGVDQDTHEFDGSVRYYGDWDGVHKSGIKTSVNFYGTYEFNADNKVINASEFFDVGGLMKAVAGGGK